MALREELLALIKPATPEPVDLPGLAKGYCVTQPCASDIEWALDGGDFVRVRMAVVTLCDSEGKPVFTRDDVDKVNQLGMPILTPIWNKALRLNGLKAEEGEGKN